MPLGGREEVNGFPGCRWSQGDRTSRFSRLHFKGWVMTPSSSGFSYRWGRIGLRHTEMGEDIECGGGRGTNHERSPKEKMGSEKKVPIRPIGPFVRVREWRVPFASPHPLPICLHAALGPRRLISVDCII